MSNFLINTRAVGTKIQNDAKLFSGIYTIFAQLVYVAFLTYALISNRGSLPLNVALISVSVLFEAFLILKFIKHDFLTRDHAKKIARFFRITTLMLKAFSLCIGFYGIHVALSEVDTVSLLFSVLIFFAWLSSTLIELLRYLLDSYINLSIDATKKDLSLLFKVYAKFTHSEYVAVENEKLNVITEEYKKELSDKAASEKALKEAEKLIEREKKREELKEKANAIKSKFTSFFKKSDDNDGEES